MRSLRQGLALLGLALLAVAFMGCQAPAVAEPQTLHADLIGELPYNNMLYRWTDSETGAICYYTQFRGASGVQTFSCIPGR